MKVVYEIQSIKHELANISGEIGFVPTMGALHEGHISLVKHALEDKVYTVVSIYVNPTQFNSKEDLKNYPRNFDKDISVLEKTGCNLVFLPDDNQMYPEPDFRKFDFGFLEKTMEGTHRPGHFNGVAKIVTKLFDIVKPSRAYFGLKDFQQLAIIQKLVKDYNYPVKIVSCPIVREKDGLAMSSRNQLLGKKERFAAPMIYETLQYAKNTIKKKSIPELKIDIENIFNTQKILRLEYFEVVDDLTLEPVSDYLANNSLTACIAVWAGNVRLIDNVQLNS